MTFEQEVKTYLPNLIVSRETCFKINVYREQVNKWNKAFSLIQEKTFQDFYVRHIIDSLQIIKFIPDLTSKVIDIGTGAGFPGMVLAMYGYKKVTCVDSNKKKIIFLDELARITRTSISLKNDRAEKISDKFDFVVSRACSSLVNLLSLMKDVSRETTQGIFHKGENHMAEVEEAKRKWKFEFDLHSSITEEKSKIIIIKNLELK